MSDPVGEQLVRRLERVRFTPVRLREGYDMAEVDELLDELVQAVRAGHPLSPMVEAARFTPVRMREGYDMADVDRFLREVAVDGDRVAALPDLPAEAVPAPEARVQRPDRPAHTSVIQEQKGLFARLFGR